MRKMILAAMAVGLGIISATADSSPAEVLKFANLPPQYRQVEYIATTATTGNNTPGPYIITDYTPNFSDTIAIGFSLYGNCGVNIGYHTIWCARSSASSYSVFAYNSGTSSNPFTLRLDHNAKGSGFVGSYSFGENDFHTLVVSGAVAKAWVDGIPYVGTVPNATSGTAGGPLMLFACGNYGSGKYSSLSNYSNMRLYSFTVTGSDGELKELKMKLVPCLDTADNDTPGLYDLANSRFYPSSDNTRPFTIYGNEVLDGSKPALVVANDPAEVVAPAVSTGLYWCEDLAYPLTLTAGENPIGRTATALYACSGYALETSADRVTWTAPVTNAATLVTFETAPETSVRITWLWQLTDYKVAADATPFGEIAFSSAASDGFYPIGTTVSLTWSSRVGQAADFKGWTVNGEDVGAANPLVLTVTEPLEVKAAVEIDTEKALMRLFGGLPQGYTQVEYIAVANNSQYIDTHYNPTLATDIELECWVPNFTAQNSIYWTRRSGSGEDSFGLIFQANKPKTIRAYRLSNGLSSDTTTLTEALPANAKIPFATSGGTFTINAEQKNFAEPTAESLDYSIYLFRLNDGGALNVSSVIGTRLYSFRIKESGKYVRAFVPCKDPEGVYGLYELNTRHFFANDGGNQSFNGGEAVAQSDTLEVTGDPFECGAPDPVYGTINFDVGEEMVATMPSTVVTNVTMSEECELLGWELFESIDGGEFSPCASSTAETVATCAFTPVEGRSYRLVWKWGNVRYFGETLPAGYERLAYVEQAVGENRYVNTRYTPDFSDSIFMLMRPLNPSANTFAFCARSENGENGRQFCLLGVSSKWRCDYNDTQGVTARTVESADLTLAASGGKFYCDGDLIKEYYPLTGAAGGPLMLFASYNTETTPGEFSWLGNYTAARIYEFRVWDKDGNPKVGMVPCRRVSDGECGFYDVVRGEFLAAGGSTGALSGGAIGPRTAELTVKKSVAEWPGTATPSIGSLAISTFGEPYTATIESAPIAITNDSYVITYTVAGWTLTVTNAAEVETKAMSDATTRTTCTFVPELGDHIALEWQISAKTNYLGRSSKHTPRRYQEFDYLEGSKSVAVHTDYTPNPSCVRTELEFTLMQQESLEAAVNSQCLFCARKGGKNASYSAFYLNTKVLSMRVGSAEQIIPNSTEIIGQRLKLMTASNRVWIATAESDQVTVGTYDPAFTATGGAMTFFASYGDSATRSSVSNSSNYRFHSFKAYELVEGEERLVRWFVPCADRVTGVLGLYDVVTRKFYPNSANLTTLNHGEQILRRYIAIVVK